MPKLTIMKGLPGCGKSTKAKKIMEESGNTIRLNRDLMRKMLHFDKWSPQNEKLTIKGVQQLAMLYLDMGKNVIIDDTNLNEKVFESWRKFYPNHSVINMTGVAVIECIKRDMLRKNSVGFATIINMARRYGLYNYMREDVIVDIDGTLCDISDRLHWISDPSQKAWDSFFADIPNDKPRMDIIEQVRELSNKYNIVLVSGRPEEYRRQTMEWMSKYRVPYETLMMRKHKDKRPDDIVKKEILDTFLKKDNIKLVIDDRPRVIRMWKENGLEVQDVGNGVEF